MPKELDMIVEMENDEDDIITIASKSKAGTLEEHEVIR